VPTAFSGESPTPVQSEPKPRRKIFRWLVLLGILVSLVTGAAYFISSNSEPEYRDVTLSKWISRYQDEVDAEQQRKEAAEAVRHIGLKAVPLLVKWAGATDSPLKQKLERWADMLDNAGISIDFTDAEDYQQRALVGFSLLGAQGKAAIPDLQRLLGNTNSVNTAAQILCNLGTDAVPALLTGLTNSDTRIQSVTAYAIGVRNSSITVANSNRSPIILPVPLLLALSTNSVPQARELAAQELGNAVTRKTVPPEVGVALLTRLLKDPNRQCQNEAATALAKLGPDARSAIPVMLSVLKDYTNGSFAARHSINVNTTPVRTVDDFAVMLYALQLSNGVVAGMTQVAPSGTSAFTWTTGPSIRPPAGLIPRSDTMVKSLQALHAEPSEVIQVLEDNLQSTKIDVCFSAINPLASYGPQAKTSLPRLLQIADGNNIYVRTIILHAVDQIDPDAARTNLTLAALGYTNAGVTAFLTTSLMSKDPFVRRLSAHHLGNFGSAAVASAPKLMPLVDDENESVRVAAVEALKKIDPDAAAKAGPK
jgi:HEAT repeat protein